MSVMHRSSALSVMLLAAAASCKSDTAPATTRTAALQQAAPGSAEPAQTPAVHVHMAEHYAQAERMKRSLLRGDLAEYRQAASWLAEHELSGEAPDTWREPARAMQDAARSGRDGQGLEDAALALGRVGQACAACHSQLGKPQLTPGEPPAEGSGAQQHMARHQWASDRLWDGLIAPSDALWIRGAELMADAPLEPAAIAPAQSVAPQVGELAARVHDQANAARLLPPAERGLAYARLVQSCSACHGALRLQPK